MIATYNRLLVHVSASDREVIKAARRKIKKIARRSRLFRGERHKFFRAMIKHHHDWQNLCRHYRM